MDRVIFLDRDGTINEEVEYLHRPEDLRLLPGVGEAIRRLREHGFAVRCGDESGGSRKRVL